MSRTTRYTLTDKNHREARKGRKNSKAAWAMAVGRSWQSPRGGMMMHSRNTGDWWDELARSKHARKAEKRRQRTRENRAALKDQEV